LSRALAAQPIDPQEKARQAAAAMQAGKPEVAIPLYQELMAAFPGNSSFALNLAIAQFKARRYEDAVNQCQVLVRTEPRLFPAWLFLGAGMLELGRAAPAIDPLRRALALQPGDRNARVMLADALLQTGHYEEAARHFAEAGRLLSDNPRVVYGLARSREGLAMELFERLEKTAPGSAELAALAGDLEWNRDQLARAFRHYREALRLRPSMPGIHASIARIYERTGHPDWAAIEEKEEKKATAAPLPPLYGQARELLQLSRQGLERLRQLPPSPERLEAGARELEQKGRYPEAAAAWREALRLSPGNARIERQLALALCQGNDCVSALPLLSGLLARDRNSAELQYLYGRALSANQEAAKALPYLEKAVELDAHFLPARAALGEAYLEAGEPRRAIPHLEAALSKDPDGSRHYQIARAYRVTGEPTEASAALREYRQILSRLQAAQRDEPVITPPLP
jgi:predicted Zn-dependent protease